MAINVGGRYSYDPITQQLNLNPRQKTGGDILSEVKAYQGNLIRVYAITDKELMDIIYKVQRGYRNVRYIVDVSNYHRLQAVAQYIVNNYA